MVNKKVRYLTKAVFGLFLSLVLIFASVTGVSVSAQEVNDSSFDQLLEQLRHDFFSSPNHARAFFDVGMPQIFVEGTDIIHTPPEELTRPLPLPADAQEFGIAPLRDFIPYQEGDQRLFRFPNRLGTLTKQGTRVNVWTMDDATAARITDEMVAHFDYIVNRMEQSFAPFNGVQITTAWPDMPIVGDVHQNGSVNVLIHDLGGGGLFSSGDYTYGMTAQGHVNPIALFHVNSNFLDNQPVLNNIFAHEFQHLLFHLHFSVYLMVTGTGPVTGQQFLWLNETLSELAGFLYAYPGYETILPDRTFNASGNSYANPNDPRIGDFVNFNNAMKGYGMAQMHGIHMHRATTGYSSTIYDFLRGKFGNNHPATSSSEFLANNTLIQQSDMRTIVGNAFAAANLTGSTGAQGGLAFDLLYFIFMEAFAADGGSVNGLTATAFLDSPFSAHRLWGVRPNLGLHAEMGWVDGAWGHNGVFASLTSGVSSLETRSPFPQLQSGGTVSLVGYNNHPGPATHEMFYRLVGESTANPDLTISIADNDPSTRFYVVVPNDPAGSVSNSLNRTFGGSGARIYSLTGGGTTNTINTGGQVAYLFVSTLFRNVNTQVTYTWGAVPNLLNIAQPLPVNITRADALAGQWNLPSTVDITVEPAGPPDTATVTWDAVTGFDSANTAAQTITVNGTVDLPSNVTNTNNVSLSVTTTIYVDADIFAISPTTVTLTNASTHTVTTSGDITGAITIGALNPANADISVTINGNDINVAFIGIMPHEEAPDAIISGPHMVEIYHEGIVVTLSIDVNIPAYIPGIIMFPVTVSGSHAGVTGAGDYEPDATVTINAGTRTGYTFAGWTASPSVIFTDASDPTTTFIMPSSAVTVTANWTPDEILPTATPIPPTPTPVPPTPTPILPTPTPVQPTPTLIPQTPTPVPPGQWDPPRRRTGTTPTQTNVTPTQTPSPTPTPVAEPEPAVIEPIQTRSFTTIAEFRQVAPSLASSLFELRLLVGTGVDATGAPTFGLNQPLNRMEALTLVVRLMGLEERALAYTGPNPFGDTPDWGSRIAAFAYNEGITAGTGNGLFEPERIVTYQEFTAFLLRVLGYSEADGDFLFEQALSKAVNVGLYSESQRNIQEGPGQYLRSDAVLNMVNALLTNTRDANTNLLDTLVSNNVIERQLAIRFIADVGDIIQF